MSKIIINTGPHLIIEDVEKGKSRKFSNCRRKIIEIGGDLSRILNINIGSDVVQEYLKYQLEKDGNGELIEPIRGRNKKINGATGKS